MNYSSKVALLAGSIDYAGTFAPASLSLENALKKAATYRREAKHPWLMGKVALPIADLMKLTPQALYDSGADGSPWFFTALGSNDLPADEFPTAVEFELREILKLNDRWSGSSLPMQIVAHEVKLPAALTDAGGATAFQSAFFPLLERALTLAPHLTPFFEVPWDGEWKSRLDIVTKAFDVFTEDRHERNWCPGIKVRTGGKYVPTMEQVAEAIYLSRVRMVPFKATQGLHHAMTHDKVLGFVNLFFALCLGSWGSEEFRPRLVECLSDEDSKHFRLGQKLRWKNIELDMKEVEQARRGDCFGSCSVDEPDQFLGEIFTEKS